MALFISQLYQDPRFFLSWVFIVVFSICIHELAHVYGAAYQGDDTPVRQGYLTLNPLRLMGVYSLVMLAVVGIAWGRVPVNPRAMRHPWSHAVVSAVGPLANLGLALAFAILYGIVGALPEFTATETFSLVFAIGVRANCLLALFNLLPIPMLDGWEVYAAFVPAMKRLRPDQLYTAGWIVFMALILTPGWRMLSIAAQFLAGLLLRGAAGAMPGA